MRPLTIISRDDAQYSGRVKFFTGAPCKRGHLAERYVVNGGCCDCMNRKRSPGPQLASHRNARQLPPVAFPALEAPPTDLELAAIANRLQLCIADWLDDERDPTLRPHMPPKAPTFASLRAAGWTDAQMIAANYAQAR